METENEDIFGCEAPETPVESGDTLRTYAPSTVAPPSTVQNVETEVWKGIYVDFAEQDPHIACWDAYTGEGGFLGNVDEKGAYSYIIAKITENFWKTRVKLTILFNLCAPYINAKVKPVFALGVEDSVTISGDLADNDPWLEHVDDATGTGTSLNAIREDSSIKANVLDVCYIVMDKVDGKVIEYVKSTLDVDGYETDARTKKLTSVTFWEPSVIEDDKEVFIKHEWRVENGNNELVVWKGRADNRFKSGYKFKPEPPVKTGLHVMNVYAQFAETSATGIYKPRRPQSYAIARICASLYNSFSLLNYLMFKQGHGLYVFQGDIDGLRDPMSNVASIPANEPNGRSYSMPVILTPDASMPVAHLNIIKEYIGFAMAMMSNNGVAIEKSTAESGLAKAFDMIADVSEYNRTIEMNKRTDKWRKGIFNLFMGRSDEKYEYLTDYPKEFTQSSSADPADLMEIASGYVEKGMTKAAEHLYKTVINMTTKDLTQEERNDVKEDIARLMNSAQGDSVNRNKKPTDPIDGDDQ